MIATCSGTGHVVPLILVQKVLLAPEQHHVLHASQPLLQTLDPTSFMSLPGRAPLTHRRVGGEMEGVSDRAQAGRNDHRPPRLQDQQHRGNPAEH